MTKSFYRLLANTQHYTHADHAANGDDWVPSVQHSAQCDTWWIPGEIKLSSCLVHLRQIRQMSILLLLTGVGINATNMQTSSVMWLRKSLENSHHCDAAWKSPYNLTTDNYTRRDDGPGITVHDGQDSTSCDQAGVHCLVTVLSSVARVSAGQLSVAFRSNRWSDVTISLNLWNVLNVHNSSKTKCLCQFCCSLQHLLWVKKTMSLYRDTSKEIYTLQVSSNFIYPKYGLQSKHLNRF